MPVRMKMPVCLTVSVDVPMGMGQTGLSQQLLVSQDGGRSAGSCQTAVVEHENKVGNVFNDVKVVCGRHNRPPRVPALDQKADDFPLALGV